MVPLVTVRVAAGSIRFDAAKRDEKAGRRKGGGVVEARSDNAGATRGLTIAD
jgi:hypothetical protein